MWKNLRKLVEPKYAFQPGKTRVTQNQLIDIEIVTVFHTEINFILGNGENIITITKSSAQELSDMFREMSCQLKETGKSCPPHCTKVGHKR